MARLPPPVTMITCSIPLAIASARPYWMVGLSTRGSISFGCAFVTGRKRVPRPADGKIALRTVRVVTSDNLSGGHAGRDPTWPGGKARTRRGRRPADPPRRRQRHFFDPGHDRPPGDHLPSLDRTSAARGPHIGRV